jgi:DNA-cytosine methyltransferase
MKNYPKTKQIGSVIDIKGLELPKIDLLIGGSPCQSFSNAGNGKGFDGKSGLFWEYVRILKEVKPTYFLLENVKMKKEWQNIISEALGVEPIEINSKYFVPQNRPRLYWTNIKVENIPTTFYHCINDILENASNEYYLTEKQKSILNLNFKWSENEIIRHKAGKHQQDNIFRYDGIMGCLSASTHGAARHLTKTYLPNGEIRRLTENEVEKLQGVPIDYTNCVSSSKRYEMLGNGWTVDVIAHIFAGLS